MTVTEALISAEADDLLSDASNRFELILLERACKVMRRRVHFATTNDVVAVSEDDVRRALKEIYR